MKIAILHSGDLENISPGGISQYIEKLIKYNEKNEIVVLGTVEENSKYTLMKKYIREVEGRKYTFMPITTNRKHPLSIYYFLRLLRIKKILKQYDIIYAQRMEYALPFVVSKLRKKVVVAVHGSGAYSKMFWGNFIGSIYLLVEKISLQRSAKIIVLLKRKEYGVPYYKKRFNKEKVIYGKVPIDLEYFFINKDAKEKKNIIIYFGRIDNNPKRILLIPEIAGILKDKINDFKIIMIGNGEDKDILLQKINEFQVNDYVEIREKMKHGKELTEIINTAKVSIILSKFEGICMSALESLACGVPVIATDAGDIGEYINAHENGVVVENISDEKQIIIKVSNELEKVLNGENKILCNEIYKKYEGKVVMKELENVFNCLVEENNVR